MEGLGRYLFTVICAAIIASLIITITADKGAASTLLKVVSGIFVVIIMITPIKEFSLVGIADYWSSLSIDASDVIADGENVSKNALIACIEDQTESYILDKASALGLDISVEVSVSTGETPVPTDIVINGNAAPYARHQLQEKIAADLGIAEANIIWN